jgi:RNA recognition motif-containing protein
LFVGNLSYDVTDRELNALFRPLKNIRDVRVAIDRRTGQPRGFAHADFTDVESAVIGKRKLEGQQIRGRELKLDFSHSSRNAAALANYVAKTEGDEAAPAITEEPVEAAAEQSTQASAEESIKTDEQKQQSA